MVDKRYNPNNTDTHRQCAKCGDVKLRTEFYKAVHNHDGLVPYCKECTRAANAERYRRRQDFIAERRRALKQECLDAMGGECVRCGYNEFMSALHFHHDDDKDGDIGALLTKAAAGNGVQRARLMAELEKCRVLCSNCHNSFHFNEWP